MTFLGGLGLILLLATISLVIILFAFVGKISLLELPEKRKSSHLPIGLENVNQCYEVNASLTSIPPQPVDSNVTATHTYLILPKKK